VFKFERLAKHHDRAGFDCGVAPLNHYLREIATQHEAKGIARTYVIVDEANDAIISGYLTLTFCQVTGGTLPPAVAKKLPQQIPAMRLARLAVAKAQQRQGIGHMLLSYAFQMVERAEKIAGGVGLFVDAKDAEAACYYSQFGFVPLEGEPLTLFLPIQTIRQHNAEIG